MLLRLMLLMTVVPAIELVLLIKVHGFFATYYGGFMGLLVTVGTILFTGVVGAHLARSQGFSVLQRLQSQMQSGQNPTSEVIDGVMILFGGALLLTPGFLTDFVGFSMLFPMSRGFFKGRIMEWAKGKIATGQVQFSQAGGQSFHFGSSSFNRPPQRREASPEVIDAEIIKD